jgi:hypothetical protein
MEERRESSTPPSWWFESILALARARQARLLPCLDRLIRVLERHSIPYWLTGGTLLGAFRHEGFVPHDDDLDLGCFSEDVPRIKAAVMGESFAESWEWRDDCLWEKLSFCSIALWPGTREEVGIDLWHRARDGPVDERLEQPDELFPLMSHKRQFCGRELPVPSDSAAYLQRLYPGWEEECVVFAHHDTFSIGNMWRVPLALYEQRVCELGHDRGLQFGECEPES